MLPKNQNKIIAGYSIAALLASTLCTTGCSDRKEIKDDLQDKRISQQQKVLNDDENEKAKELPGKEIKIRGKSG